MKIQFKASYLNQKVFNCFAELRANDDFHYKVLGLLESVSTFDTISNIDLRNPNFINSILAVANNLITRGTPTICSNYVSSKLERLTESFTPGDYFNSLHLVDPRSNTLELYNDDLESNFERAFLNIYFPFNKKYLIQFFQHQRERKTLVNSGNDNGRVDFSFEAPYFRKVKKTTVYHRDKNLKQRSVLIIEVDGKKYHNILIDDIRDYETARFGHNTSRITEDNVPKDLSNLLKKLSETAYFKTIEYLLNIEFEQLRKLQTLVLSPVAIARIQKVINQYLIVRYDELKSSKKEHIKIAIVERDVPCGHLAVNDLNELYKYLTGLEGNRTYLPKIDATIFADPSYINNELQQENFLNNSQFVDSKKFDLIIDISTLWRTGVFKSDLDYSNSHNSIIIRSAHFTEFDCHNEVYCSNKIDYQDLTQEIGNEQHIELNEAIPYIEYFLQNIFHKDKFRKGQLPILNRALKNKTIIGLLPTGGGKSLTYQLAALLQPGVTIIIDPIRSLMVDQYESLLKYGIDKCDFINSILSREEKEFIQEKILPLSKTQFLFCSPERLVIEEFRDSLKKAAKKGCYFSYCVIDEAHCVSEWGHDFRTPYLNLGENAIKYCKTYDNSNIPIFGLTATASFDVLADIERELKIKVDDGNAIVRYENTVRDEINYQIINIRIIPHDDLQINKKTIGKEKLSKSQAIISGINNPDELLLSYNDQDKYSEILQKSYNDYLPNSEKNEISMEDYIRNQTNKILLTEQIDIPFIKNDKGRYNYGIIVFCPHKNSELGVDTFYQDLELSNDKIVFFKGSSSSMDKEEQDIQSFKNLKSFKDDEASVMVATKAFGMGIDKPNIRLTIHNNIASSIESFVQESGRAGRDGKTSLSIILYNNQIERDRQILDNFYKNSFKGADKERSVIWELRDKIFYPNITYLTDIKEKISDEFEEEYKIDLGKIASDGKDWTDKIFVEVGEGIKIGSLDLVNKTTSIAHNYQNKEQANLVLNRIVMLIPGFQDKNKAKIRELLEAKVATTQLQEGLEHILKNNDIDLTQPIIIPFKNKYYCKDDKGYKIVDEFAFDEHFNYWKDTKIIKWLLPKHSEQEIGLRNKFRSAIKDDTEFEAFILNLPISKNTDPRLWNELKIRYYAPRNQDDTAKAIYRLTSIGIIDTYTIEYQQKVYKVKLSRKTDRQYFQNYETLVSRYTSPQEAKKLRIELEEDYLSHKDNSTVISKCLEHLTKFIYEKIAEKRKRAINDMVSLCDESILITDPFEQSNTTKENIYYYFNAKYAREGNAAQTKDGTSINADLSYDYLDDLPINETIWKYIELIIDYDDNGAIINNIKHLRGATMRMLRGTSGAPQFNILKAYSLYLLSINSPQLVQEAIEELKIGINKWYELEPEIFDFEGFILRFKENIVRHLGEIPASYFGDIDDDYYTTKNLTWLIKFNNKFLKEYNNADGTSN